VKGQIFPADGYRMRFKERLVEMAGMRAAEEGAPNIRIKVVFKTTFWTPRLGHRSGSFMGARLGC
jgi:hypothetical protein